MRTAVVHPPDETASIRPIPAKSPSSSTRLSKILSSVATPASSAGAAAEDDLDEDRGRNVVLGTVKFGSDVLREVEEKRRDMSAAVEAEAATAEPQKTKANVKEDLIRVGKPLTEQSKVIMCLLIRA